MILHSLQALCVAGAWISLSHVYRCVAADNPHLRDGRARDGGKRVSASFEKWKTSVDEILLYFETRDRLLQDESMSVPSAQPTSTPSPTISSLGPTLSPDFTPFPTPALSPIAVPSQAPSDIPTQVPSDAPTQDPSDIPTQVPSDAPTTLTPSDIPTQVPSNAPTTLTPSDIPTQSPSNAPTLDPSDIPTQTPSQAPTSDSPTTAPSDVTSIAPSLAPDPTPAPSTVAPAIISASPTTTLAPTTTTPFSSAAPTTAPTSDTCVLDISINCTVNDNGEACENYRPVLEPCAGLPTSIGMLYNGGNCSQNSNDQGSSSSACESFGAGPPVVLGTRSYLFVTDSPALGQVFFDAMVTVGNFFNITAPPNATFQAEMFLYIYSQPGQDESSLLQLLTFDGTCSNANDTLQLGESFGAVQVTSWNNTEQGYVNAFTQVTLDIALDFAGDNATNMNTNTHTDNININYSSEQQAQQQPQDVDTLKLVNVTVETNFVGSADLSTLVAGLDVPVGNGSFISVPVPTLIDRTEERMYEVSIFVSGIDQATGELCSGTVEESYQVIPIRNETNLNDGDEELAPLIVNDDELPPLQTFNDDDIPLLPIVNDDW